MRIPPVLAENLEYIKPSYFESIVHRYLCQMMFNYFRKYKTLPTAHALKEQIKHECAVLGHPEELKIQLSVLVDEIANIDLAEAKYLMDRLIQFCIKNRAREAAVDLINVIDDFDAKGTGDFMKINKKLREVSAIGVAGGKGFDFMGTLDELPSILANSKHYAAAEKIPTGFKFLDHSLDGGLGAGEIAFIAAPPGAGKSTLLVQFAAGAMLGGYNVMIYTMELKEIDYAMRLQQRLTGVGKHHLIQNSQRYQSRKGWMIQSTMGAKVLIQYYPPATATVDALKSHFSRVKAEEMGDENTTIRPWLVIIDYVEKLKLGDMSKIASHELVGVAVDELIGMGHEFSTPILTASQINREGYKKVSGSQGKKHVDKDNIATSWRKVEAADLILTFNQSEYEKAAAEARIYIAKSRRGRDNVHFKVIDHRPTMNMIEVDRDGSIITAYEPKRDGHSIEIRPAWDNGPNPAFNDETSDGWLQPPDVEFKAYLADQLQGLSEEQVGVDLDHVRNAGNNVGNGGNMQVGYQGPPVQHADDVNAAFNDAAERLRL